MLTHIFTFCATFLLASFMISATLILFVGLVYVVRSLLQDMQRVFFTHYPK